MPVDLERSEGEEARRRERPTVAEALEAFLTRHRIDRAGYAARRFDVRLGPLVFRFPNPGLLRLHDLHHVALGLPPTFWGEVEVSAFELRTGAPTILIGFLCVGALCLGALLAPLRVVRAWRRYRGARNLYAGRYEEVAALDLDELRRRCHLG